MQSENSLHMENGLYIVPNGFEKELIPDLVNLSEIFSEKQAPVENTVSYTDNNGLFFISNDVFFILPHQKNIWDVWSKITFQHVVTHMHTNSYKL